jgi:hypothetical protein
VVYYKRPWLYPKKRRAETKTAGNWDRLHAAYAKHMHSIRDSLPKSARLLANITFHDARVEQVKIPSKQEVLLRLSRGWVASLFEDKEAVIPEEFFKCAGYSLHFTGVKKAWVPYSIVGDIWLLEEMHLSDIAAFDYHVLLYRDEIRILANKVRLRPLMTDRWSK